MELLLRGVDFQLELWISANSIRNINTAKSLQNNRKQFDSRRKKSLPLGPGSCLDYTSILIHLLGKVLLLYIKFIVDTASLNPPIKIEWKTTQLFNIRSAFYAILSLCNYETQGWWEITRWGMCTKYSNTINYTKLF